MGIGRRIFLRTGTLGLLALRMALITGGGMLMAGCTVEDEILSWIQIGIPAVKQILGLLVSVGVIACLTCSALATALIAALNAVSSAIDTWKKDPHNNTTDNIRAALQAALAAATTFFESFVLPAGDQQVASLIEALVGLVLNTLAGFIGKIAPSTKTVAVVPIRTELKLNGRMVPITPKFLKSGEFKSQWNALAVQYNHPEVKL